ncbi:MAG: EamA family transporter [Coriobacteriaceae bacterium]|nr:EamA family transporter [Coriobacteriaceae bacterium]
MEEEKGIVAPKPGRETRGIQDVQAPREAPMSLVSQAPREAPVSQVSQAPREALVSQEPREALVSQAPREAPVSQVSQPSWDVQASLPAQPVQIPQTGKPERRLPVAVYKLLLVCASLIWGFGFVVMKDTVDMMPPSCLLGVRFLITGLILGLVFFKRMRHAFDRDHLLFGSVIGVMLFLGFWMQTLGLIGTTPGKNAFLTATYVVVVPFIAWLVIRRRPSVYNIIAALVCIGGMGFVSLQGTLSIEAGDALTMVSALFFAVHIVYVARWSQGRDVFVLTVYQFLAAGICGLAIGLPTEAFPPVEAVFAPAFLGNMAYLIVFGSCLALLFQNMALVHVPPAQSSLFLSLEAVFGVLFSVLLYNESLSLRLIAGFALIFASIVISETFPLKLRRSGTGPDMRRTT